MCRREGVILQQQHKKGGKMRKFVLVFTLVMVLGFAGSSGAALFDRGGGMIYDDGRNIT
jgi:hypothetical protein